MRTVIGTTPKALRIIKSLLVLILVRGSGTLLSFLITVLIVDRFGAGAAADGLLAVRRLVIRLGDAGRLLILNALVPWFARALDEPDCSRFRRAVLLRLYQAGALGLVVSALISVFSADIVQLVGAGFDQERRAVATNALYVFAFLLVPMLLAGVLTAAANVRGVYGLPDLAQLAPRLLALAVLALLPPTASAAALPWAYVIGASAGLAVILVWMAGRLRAIDGAAGEDTTDPGPDQAQDPTGARFWALLFTLAGAQIALWIQLHYIADAGAGAMTYWECSQAIMAVLPAVFLRSAFSVAYAESARQLRGSEQGVSAALLARLIEIGLYLMLPIILLPTIFADHISYLLFVRGSFSDSDAHQVALLIMAFSVGAVIAVVQNGLNIALMVQPGLPMARIGALQMVVLVACNLILLRVFMPLFGIFALPIAVAGAGLAVVAARFAVTRAWRPTILLLLFGRRFWSILLAAGLFSAVGLWLHSLLPMPAQTPTLSAVAMIVTFGMVGTALYLLVGLGLGLWRPGMLRRASAGD